MGEDDLAAKSRRPRLHGYVDVRKLLALHEVIARGSIAQAAASLHVTAGAVSQQIQSLEQATGRQLLIRSPRGVRPTSAGQQLALHAEAILSELEQVDVAMGPGGSATTTIASFSSATRALLAPALRSLAAEPGPAAVFVRELDPREALPSLASGEVDLAIVHGHELKNQPVTVGCELVHLIDDPLVLALPDERFDETPLSLSDLAGERWLLAPSDSSCHATAVRACHAAGFDPIVSSESQDWAAVMAMVGAGLGVALVPAMALEGVPDGVVLAEPLGAPIVRRVHAAYRRGGGARPMVTRLIDALVREAAGIAGDRRISSGCAGT